MQREPNFSEGLAFFAFQVLSKGVGSIPPSLTLPFSFRVGCALGSAARIGHYHPVEGVP